MLSFWGEGGQWCAELGVGGGGGVLSVGGGC